MFISSLSWRTVEDKGEEIRRMNLVGGAGRTFIIWPSTPLPILIKRDLCLSVYICDFKMSLL